MATYLLDTTVIIDTLHDKLNRKGLLLDLLEAGHSLACCAISVAEVYAGMRPKEEAATRELLGAWNTTLFRGKQLALLGN